MGDLVRDDWDRKYSRQSAAFPNGEGFGIGRAGKISAYSWPNRWSLWG